MKIVIAASNRDELFRRFPPLKDNIDFRRFLSFLLVGRRDEEGNLLMVYDYVVTFILRKWWGFDLPAFVEQFRQEVAPGLLYSGYSRKEGKSRTITSTGLPGDIRELFRRPAEGEEKYVFLDDGKVADMRNARTVYAELQAQVDAELEAIQGLTTATELIVRQQNSVRYESYTKATKGNEEAARQALAEYDAAPEEKERMERILQNVLLHRRKPIYRPSPKTARATHHDLSIHLLPKSVRNALFRGCWQVDLQSSQFLLNSQVYGLPKAKKFIETGESFWSRFPPEHKAKIKQATYSIYYGGSKKMIDELLGDATEVFWRDELIQEAWSFASDVKSDWYSGSVTEFFDPISGQLMEGVEHAGQGMARKAQAIETQVMASVYRVYEEHPGHFVPLLYLSDGVVMSLRDSRYPGRVQKMVDAAIQEAAGELGFIVRTEWCKL